MNKSRINILVVEDDATQGKALEEAFKRAGYNVVLKDSSMGALTQAQHMEFHGMVVDCMLPKMNGVDLVEEILKIVPHKPKIFMVSGIYKDRKFIQDALEKTKAESFFIKPYDLEALVTGLETQLATLVEPERPPVLQLYGADSLDNKELTSLIEQESTLHAFHLIKLYQRIQETKLTGELNLTSAIGDFSTVSFFEGQVFAVKTPNKESFFGSLAISKGFVSPEEVLEALNTPSQKMLGQKLIDAMSLSPHAIQIILTEQLALRLSQTVQDDVVSLQWDPKQFLAPADILEREHFDNLQADWLNSKVTPDWVHSTMMVWGAFQLDGRYHHSLKGPQTVEKILNNKQFDSDQDLLPLFRALVNGEAFMGSRVEEKPDFTFLASRLDHLTDNMKSQNYFQFLSVGEKAHQREISRSFDALRTTFDPKNLPPECPPDIVTKATRVFAFAQKAYKTLSNEADRTNYMKTLRTKRTEEALEMEPIYHAAILELQSGHPGPASLKFQTLLDRKIEFRDLRAYRIWAGLKCDKKYNELRLDQIPPEERHSAAFMMAKGVFLRTQKQYRKALEAFRTAHILDPRLNIAKYELQKLASDLEKSSSNREMAREVTAIVEGLLGKSKVRRGA